MPSTVIIKNPRQTCRHQPTCGCKHAGCCFECPLSDCRYDAPHVQEITSSEPRFSRVIQREYDLRRILKTKERQAVAVGLWLEGHNTLQIAASMGVGRRTITDYLREVRRNGK